MITNSVYKDGFGENFKFIIYCILYAEYMNEEFHYTPLSEIVEHNYMNDPNFISKKEKLINIINHYPIVNNNIVYLIPSKFVLLNFFENNVDFCVKSKTLKKIKKIFRDVNENVFDTSFFNIAIHIRRMNELDIKNNINFDKIPGTDIPNDIYKDIIRQLQKNYKNSKIHIYSQGDKKDFDFNEDIILHLNDTIENTFKSFVYADVLVVAPSSFSYTAALLSDNIIYCIKSCDKTLPFWNIIQNYTCSKDKYMFFIRRVDNSKMKVYFDSIIGVFYIEKDNVKQYINIFDFMNK